jgi:hypothetical protein
VGLVKEYVDTKGFGEGSKADVISTFGGGAIFDGLVCFGGENSKYAVSLGFRYGTSADSRSS